MKKKVAVGLSGGVDSAVTASLLKSQGYDVIGVFMKNWSDDFGIDGSCPWEIDQADAIAVAKHLNIPFLSYNFEIQYREKVMEYFFDEYKKGRTPNPDILCNSEIKFNVFLKKCLKELEVDFIATGHYAKKTIDSNNISHLKKGIDTKKDQSYFLCRLTQEELSKSLFPLGDLEKSEVRNIANDLDLPVATKKDSQGICFVGKINVKKFLESELGMKPGKIIDIDTNKIMGDHKGLWFYTIGQREGLGFGGGPWFVVKKDIDNNIVYIAKGNQNIHLFQNKIVVEDLQILNEAMFQENKNNLEVSLRYHQVPNSCNLEFANNKILVNFEKPQRAVAPGQFACFFVDDEIVASAVISNY